MNKLGFYGWIREGVRRAVLLGLSDAVDQIGSPADKEELNAHLLSVLRQEKPLLTAPGRQVAPGIADQTGARSERKRLGRTLGEMALATPATEQPE